MSFSDDDGERAVMDVRRSRHARRFRALLIAIVLLLLFGASALVSWYVDALWFGSLGYAAVFWRTLAIKSALFGGFFIATVVLLQAAFWALRPRRPDRASFQRTVIINGRPVSVSFKPVARVIGWVVAAVVGMASAVGMSAEWTTFVLWWRGTPQAGAALDPIFARPITFYLLTLPAWEMLATWLTTLAVIALAAAVIYFMVSAGERALNSVRGLVSLGDRYGGLSLALGLLLLIIAFRVYIARFDVLFHEGATFSGAGYTDVHIVLPGLLWVVAAVLLGAAIALVNAVRPRRLLWLAAAIAPPIIVYAAVVVAGWYVNGFIVKPNELDRETPYIRNNITLTQQAFGLAHVAQRSFPADAGIDALEVSANHVTLDNVRLWDWRALQDTLRQIQAIRTYYDFPDIDIDRYHIDGQERQVMLAARELNLTKLPESSRNWINEKLIYTHGYGVTMNPVNGFTSEGLPRLILSDMPVHSTTADITVTRPEIYFGQETTSNVYVRTRQKEFNYPQGESNSYTTYQGKTGIPIGSMWRRLFIALALGDLSKLPFSDDITAESLLLMRREIHDRVSTIAPFLSYDPDPYIVVSRDGRLYWLMDGFTSADSFPYATRYRVANDDLNYLRNSVKVVVDAYDGTVDFYVFDEADPLIQAYRSTFPELFKDGSQMPAGVREHVRYPEMLLKVQANVYSLYHMTDPQVFYNREDLWSVASQVTLSETTKETVTQPLEPNFVMMQLPGEASGIEFIEILPFTPAKRNNLIGWIAGRSDGTAYGKALVYDFPKTRLVDGPLQVEARIDQNPQLSSLLSLWNQRGSRARRGTLLVMPIGRGLFYAEPIYLQAEQSPMPQLQLVVLAVQDRLGFGKTFEDAMQNLMSENPASAQAGALQMPPGVQGLPPGTAPGQPAAPPTTVAGTPQMSTQALIDQAARDLADYQRLTAEGKLGEAGQKLESLKRALEQLRPQAPRK